MFYLKEALFILRDHKSLGLANLLLLSLFMGSLQFKNEIRDFFSLETKTSSRSYFNALAMGNINSEYIVRKMSDLPGVAKVEFTNSKALEQEMKSVLDGFEGAEALLAEKYKTFKIDLDKGILPKSQALIREYFSRLAGNNEVTFSGVKSPSRMKVENNSLYGMFSKWSDLYFSAMFAGAWLFTLWLLSQPVKDQAFVIEKFQRKNNASVKIFGWVGALPVLAFCAVSFYNGFETVLTDFAPTLLVIGWGALFFVKKRRSPQRFI